MPIIKSSSKKAKSANIKELMTGKPGATRQKAINTIAKKQGISKEAAKKKQAVAIALSFQNVRRK